MWVYIYQNNSELAMQNAYIGEWVDVTSLTLDKSSINLTTVGQTEQITATVVPAGATVTWSSSDTSIATVDNTGLVTCVTPWNCTITAESFGVTATCNVSNPIWDIINVSTNWNANVYSWWWYWIKFYAKNNCNILKVKMLNPVWYINYAKVLKISIWSSPSATGVSYNLPQGQWEEYTLPNPYQLTAWTTYTICLAGGNNTFTWYYSPYNNFPFVWTNINILSTFFYSSWTQWEYTNFICWIKWLQTA